MWGRFILGACICLVLSFSCFVIIHQQRIIQNCRASITKLKKLLNDCNEANKKFSNTFRRQGIEMLRLKTEIKRLKKEKK